MVFLSIQFSLFSFNARYFIKLSLKLSYSRKQSQNVHLILWVLSARLSARFYRRTCHRSCTINNFYFLGDGYNTFASIFINFCNLLFYLNRKSFVPFSVFFKSFKLSIKLVHWFFHDEVVIVIRPSMKIWTNFIGHLKF